MKSLVLGCAILVWHTSFAQTDSIQIKLKNYAFCSCLSNVNNDAKQFVIRDGSSAGYFETTDYNLDVYRRIDSLAKKYAERKYLSINNRPLGLMKCLDFYNSKELAQRIKQLIKGSNGGTFK